MNTQRQFAKYDRRAETARIEADWSESPRWQGITRNYTVDDVVRLRGSIKRDNTIAKLGAEKLWELLSTPAFVNAQGAVAGNHAVQHVTAGAQAIYLTDRQRAELPTAETIRPDQSLYAVNSLPSLVRRINNAFERADQIQWKTAASDTDCIDFFAPIVAAAKAHAGSALNAFELTKNMIRAGAAGVRFDDCITSSKHNAVLMPTQEVVQKLSAARLAADVEDVATLIIAHTTANSTNLLSDVCDIDDEVFATGERTEEGFHHVHADIDHAIARGLAYAPYADVLWLETAQPDLAAARQFAHAIRREFPQQLLAYHCTVANDASTNELQRELAALGYQFQFVAPAQLNAEQTDDANDDYEEMAA